VQSAKLKMLQFEGSASRLHKAGKVTVDTVAVVAVAVVAVEVV